MTDIYARQRQLIGTTAEWGANDIVCGNGEIAVERVNATTIKLKIGDGVNKFSALPYLTGSAGSAVSGGLSFKGARDITAAAPASKSAGDYYVASADGVPAGSWTGLSARVLKGDLVLYDGAAWHAIAQDADLTKYLPLAGGTMTGPVVGLQAAGSMKINGATSGAVELAAPAVAGAVKLTLPNSVGAADDVMTSDGAGGIKWAKASTPAAALNKVAASLRNVLINGDMGISQRYQSIKKDLPHAGVNYCADRWHLVTNAFHDYEFQRIDTAPYPFSKRLRLTRKAGSAGASKISLRQIMESSATEYMVGQKTILQARIQVGAGFKGDITLNVHFSTVVDESSAIMAASGWTGGIPSVTKTITAPAAGVLTLVDMPATVPANAKAICVEVGWASAAGAAAADDWIEITGVQYEVGETATAFEHRAYASEYPLCARYFYTTVMPGVVPAQGCGTDNAFCVSCLNSGVKSSVYVPFLNQMRAKPSVVFYNPVNKNAEAHNASRNQDCSNTGSFNSGVTGRAIVTTAPGSPTAQGDGLLIHIAVDAEI